VTCKAASCLLQGVPFSLDRTIDEGGSAAQRQRLRREAVTEKAIADALIRAEFEVLWFDDGRG